MEHKMSFSDLRVAFLTLGCKVNQYETDAMKENMEKAGAIITDFHDPADIYIINTCSVTNVADKKSRQMLHRAKRKNPDAVIAAAGCYVQSAAEELEKDELVDIIIGNNKKKEIVSIIARYLEEHKKTIDLIDINHTDEFEEMGVSHIEGHTRAYIKVQDGCNQFCTYCIIPYARGRIRSRNMDEVLKEVTKLVDQGVKEFVLTGIHLSSYGAGIDGLDLLTLIKNIAAIKGVMRIRLGSLEPGIITDEFVSEIVKIKELCPHFHLSLQSACDATLKRMNRKYTIAEYMDKCSLLRKYYEHPAITTDVIVGFPGETEEEFEITRKNLESLNLYEIHVFKYSRRKGTIADQMPNQIPEQKKAARSNILLEMTKRQKKAFEEKMLFTTEEVLLEEMVEADGTIYFTGHTKNYVKTGVKGTHLEANQLVKATFAAFSDRDFIVADACE
ncbi:MAG: tRNA (N(6)-L-threonylcarbamoyladenosine(37)-C(2))-methylthiotransferase MtaB [Lachnospiraceae bacterium]|nr:tRNA (N(6)-L-threonylcarbamoyladenosine(37)-C(2))-methylthiotransferase MtaB [Lachnospiraceae bacterium]